MNRLRNLGITLFILGAMCAIASAAKMPAVGQLVPDTWPIFAGGVGISAAGLVLWHKHRRRPAADGPAERTGAVQATGPGKSAAEAGPTNAPDSAGTLLQQLLQPLDELESALEQLGAPELIGRLDDLNDRFLLPFVQRRSELLEELGMGTGSEVLATAAYGERMLNRAWSAAADGYLGEARQNVRDALTAFRQAVQQLHRAKRTGR